MNHARQVTIDALCEHFANDAMEVEEFERRVEAAHRAATNEDLKALLRDLPGGDLPATRAPMPQQAEARHGVTAAAHVKERGFVVACLGGATRKGRWTPARDTWTLAIMGGVELDFREAQFGPGVTEVHVFAMWGGVDILVPPGLRVENHGIGILGGFDQDEDAGAPPPHPEGPVLRIVGAAVMGGVHVSSRYPGESAREARRRRKLERKERKRLRGG